MARIQSIDVFRLLAITSVISIHTRPFFMSAGDVGDLYSYLTVFVNQIARYAVPFFFIISGYFWGIKINKSQSIIQPSLIMAKKIGFIFLFWSVIYLLFLNSSTLFEYGLFGPAKIIYWNIAHFVENPVSLIFEGTSVHLWFLIGLIYAVLINALFIYFDLKKGLIVFAVALYVFGLLAKAYSNTPIGIIIDFNTRNGPFFSTLFFTTGFLLSSYETKAKWIWLGSIIFVLGCLLHFTEIFILWKYFNTTVYQDYVIGTYFMGLGIALIALSNHPILKVTLLANIGRYTLGIYAVHMIYVVSFRHLDSIYSSPLWEVGLVIIVLIFSILTIKVLAKFRCMRKFIG